MDSEFNTRFKHYLIDDDAVARKVLEKFRGKLFAWDTETRGLDFSEEGFLVGFSISCNNDIGFYFPLRHVSGKNLSWEIFELFDDVLKDSNTLLYNAPFDVITMASSGAKHWKKYNHIDVYCLTYLMDLAWGRDGLEFILDENGEKIPTKMLIKERDGSTKWVGSFKTIDPGNGLKWCAKHYLGRKAPTFEETLGISSNSVGFFDLNPKDGARYAAMDAANTYALFKKIYPLLKEECPNIVELDRRVAMIFPQILMNPVHLNKAEMRGMYKQTMGQYRDLLRGIFGVSGYPFNISSPIEKSAFLTDLNINTGRKSKSGLQSTSKDVLLSLNTDIIVKTGAGREVPLAEALVEVASLPKQMDYMKKTMKSQMVRFNYNMCSQVTGRFSSGVGKKKCDYFVPLNYQNLTKPGVSFFKFEESDEPRNILGYKFIELDKDELSDRLKNNLPVVEAQSKVMNIRRAISCQDDTEIFVSRDYCQEELVYAAAVSGDPVWCDAIKSGMDLHEGTARRMFPDQEYNKHLRKLCKACNFSLLYGASAKVFAQTAQIELELAKDLHSRFWTTMKILKAFIDRKWREALNNGGNVYTLLGRPRRLASLIKSGDNKLMRDAEKAVMSHIVQGGCADVMRINLLRIFGQRGLAERFPNSFKFVGMVHDETNVIFKKDAFYDLVFEHQKIMEQTVPGTDMVLKTSVEFGNSYGETFPFVWEPKQNKFIPKV